MAIHAIALSLLCFFVGMGVSEPPQPAANRAFTAQGSLVGGGTIHINPAILVADSNADITITGGTPGAAYDITITGDTGEVETRTVILDANGNGEFEWKVRGDWVIASFELPDGTGDAAPIVQPERP